MRGTARCTGADSSCRLGTSLKTGTGSGRMAIASDGKSVANVAGWLVSFAEFEHFAGCMAGAVEAAFG